MSKKELDTFLKKKGVDDGHRSTIVEELFMKCDADHSGLIDLNEFVGHYVETSN